MSVIPMPTRSSRSGRDLPEASPVDVHSLPHHSGAKRGLRGLLGLLDVQHDSPGADVVRRYPTLPDDVYYKVVHDVEERETASTRTIPRPPMTYEEND